MKYSILTIIFLSILVTGCSSNKYLSTQRDNPIVSFVDDHSLAVKATSAVSKDTELWDKSHISIISFNNDVLIVGQVPGSDLKDRVEKIVSEIPKITKIYNQLNIKEPSGVMSRAKDSWITAAAKTQLLTEPNLSSANIKVITEEGIVYLMGNPNLEDKEVALDIVKNISGVEQVIDVFNYSADTKDS